MNLDLYKEKLNKLPPWVQDYLESMKSADYNVLICDKYGIKKIADIHKYLDLVNKIFFKELLLVSLFSKIKELFGLDDDQARKMAVDIAGMRLMVVEQWLNKDVHQYIRDLGGDPNDYEKYVEEHNKALEVEDEYFEQELKDDDDREEQEIWKNEKSLRIIENKVKDVFADKIVDVLSWDDFHIINQINGTIIHLLDLRDQVLRNELINIFLANQRIITEKQFVLKNKETLGTVGNWLKDFITQQSGAMFNIIALSDFVNNSKNGKILDSQEKKMLTKILLTYRNLKFFPQSINENKLEIIPLPEKK